MTPDDLTTAGLDSLLDLVGECGRDLASLGSHGGSDLTDEQLRRLEEPGAVESDFKSARRSLELQLGLISEAHRIVGGRLDLVNRLHRRHLYIVRYDDDHWPDRKKILEAALHDSPEEGMRRLLDSYVDALGNWELDECRRLSEIELPQAERWPDVAEMRHATTALLAGDYEEADDFLAFLADGATVGGNPSFTSPTRSVVEVLRGRLKLTLANQVKDDSKEDLIAEIAIHFENARKLDGKSAMPVAGQAALFRLKGDHERALDTAEEAIDLDANAPDGHIEAGLWAIDVGQLDDASESFDRAAEILSRHPSPLQATETELRPHPHLLWLKLAERLHSMGRNDEALSAVRRVEAASIQSAGNPKAERYELEAEILDALKRPAIEIAAACRWAGKERYWAGESPEAQGMLERAIDLDSGDAQQYFFLADIHLRSSYDTEATSSARQEQLVLAETAWEEGERRADWELHPADGWAFLTRALIAQQQADQTPVRRRELLWQAIVDLDRNIHYRPDMASAWALLSRYLRYKGFVWGAATATEQAWALDPDNATVLEERIVILSDLGDFDGAPELLARGRESFPEDTSWYDAVAGYISLRRGNWDQADAEIGRAIEADDGNLWYQSLRAQCALLRDEAGAIDRSREILHRVDGKEPADLEPGDLSHYLQIAVHVGDADRAQALLDWGRDTGILTSFSVHYYAAVIDAIRGNIALAVGLMTSAIEEATNPADVDELRALALPLLEKAAEHWPHPGNLATFSQALEEAAVFGIQELGGATNVDYPLLIDTYESATEALTEPNSDSTRSTEAEWEQTGAAVALTRLYRADGRLSEAAEWYRRLADSELFPEAGAALIEIQQELVDRAYKSLPMPIALDLSDDLTPQVEDEAGGLAPAFQALVTKMRERLLEAYGIPIPGIRVRSGQSATGQGNYVILLNETPADSGVLEPELRMDSVVRHLERVLTENLKLFVGHQEIMDMVEKRAPTHIERFEDDPGALGEFTSAVRGLVEEKVPLTDLSVLIEAYWSQRDEAEDPLGLTERLRSLPELRPSLPGNDGHHTLYRLSEGIESLFAEAIHETDRGSMLDMKPEAVRDVLAAVRSAAGVYEREAVVVETGMIRRAVRDVIQMEFPRIPVLSRTELIPPPTHTNDEIVIRM